MNIGIAEITIGTLVVTEIALTWRIWKLERRLVDTMQHFIKAKEFLGGIEKSVKDYKGTVEHIAKNGLDITAKHPTLGEFKLTIHKGNSALPEQKK